MLDILRQFPEKIITSVQEGVIQFGNQVPGIILALLIVSIGYLLAQKIAQLARVSIGTRTGDPITTNFLTKAIKILLFGSFLMYALKVAGLESVAAGILTAAGASAVVIGFAFRDIGENFISGIILSFNRPFNVNETVSVGDIFGKVQNIEFRYTKLRTFDGRDVYIPNSDVIKKPVFNYTEDGFFRFDFLVGLAYENDIAKAEQLIMEVVRNTKDVFEDETHQNFLFADELAVNSVNLKVHFWVRTFEFGMEALTVKGRVVANVKTALLKNGFGLPANIIELKPYNSPSIPLNVSRENAS